MTKPGPHPWATNDTYVAGPDIGSNTKTVPLTVHQEDGYYRSRRPGPDIVNWQLNRNALVGEALARLQAMNYNEIAYSIDHGTGSLVASCFSYEPGIYIAYPSFFYYSADNDRVVEASLEEGMRRENVGIVISSITTTPEVVDADGSETGHKVLVLTTSFATGGDNVVYSPNIAGGWAGITWSGGAPGHDWTSVACDRNTAGGASQDWCIGGYTGGASSPEIWSSTDGITFAKEAGFSAAASDVVRGLHHSCHPVGALGPDDAGNPVWLALTNNEIYRSVDHVTWSGPATLAAESRNPNTLAYSRVSRRWVCAHTGSDFGDVSYSDDNGATWTLLANALPDLNFAGANAKSCIAGDGYGTFVITLYEHSGDVEPHAYVSVDEGISWSYVRPVTSTTSPVKTGLALVEGCCILSDIDVAPHRGGYFCIAHYDDSAHNEHYFPSLRGV